MWFLESWQESGLVAGNHFIWDYAITKGVW